MSGITAQANPVKWKDGAPGAAITVFNKIIDKENHERIKAFAAIRRDDGTLFFTEAQRQSISAPETPVLKPIVPVAELKKKDAPALPPILKVQAVVAVMLSGCSVKEIAKMAHVHSIFHAQGFQAIIEQLKTKTSYTWEELNDYRRALGLASIKELLTLFPVISSETKSLDLSNIDLHSIPFEQLINFFPHLTSVNFTGCYGLTDAAVASLSDRCPNLTSVNFSSCNSLTDAAVASLSDKCPNLTSVNFAGCPNLTDAAARALADSRCADHLTSVNFTGCNGLTDAAARALADKCPNLTSVNFTNCNRLTDAAVKDLADKCPHLTSVNFTYCYSLTDAAVASLADKCPHLASVNFAFCYSLTDAAAVSLADKCPNLTSVNFTYCDRLTNAAARALARGCLKLTSISASSNLEQAFKQYRKEFAYKQPTSALGKLYRALLGDASTAILKQAITEVDSELLNRVYDHVWGLSGKPQGDDKWGERHALDEDKRNILIAAVQKSITERFESLPQGDKVDIYGKVCKFRPDRDPQDLEWGRKHALDNRALLADLLSEAAHKPDESKNKD